MNVRFSEGVGCGVESEGFICARKDGTAQPLIDGMPSAQWLLGRFQERWPSLLPHLGLEQASIMLEVRSGIHDGADAAIDEVLLVRELVNQILGDQGLHLLFEPVPRAPFHFFPATNDPHSRTVELVKRWSTTVSGQQNLLDTATASFQFNDSRLFKGVHGMQAKLELAVRVYNHFSAERDSLLALNAGMVDAAGRTRLKIASSLLESVKGAQFAAHGFKPNHVLFPPLLHDVDDLKRLMCAHSGASSFAKTSSKDVHAFLVKVKGVENMDGIAIAEARFADAVDTRASMLRIAQSVEEVLARCA